MIVIARSESTPTVDLGLVPNDTDISVAVMEKLGVPADKVTILPFPGGVTSTFDEASAVLAGLPVTLEMVAVPYAGFDQTNWWKNETGLITLNNEYIKWFYYLFKYR